MIISDLVQQLRIANNSMGLTLEAKDHGGETIYLDIDRLVIDQEVRKIYVMVDEDYIVIPKSELEELEMRIRQLKIIISDMRGEK